MNDTVAVDYGPEEAAMRAYPLAGVQSGQSSCFPDMC